MGRIFTWGWFGVEDVRGVQISTPPTFGQRYQNETLTRHPADSILALEVMFMSAPTAFANADLALFNPASGRLDAACIARELNLPVGTIAEAIGRKAPSVRKHPDASSLQSDLRRIYRIWVSVVDLYAGNKSNARIFLNAPNRNLSNQAPVEFIESGNLRPLEAFVEAIRERQPA